MIPFRRTRFLPYRENHTLTREERQRCAGFNTDGSIPLVTPLYWTTIPPIQARAAPVKYVPKGYMAITQDFLSKSNLSLYWQDMTQLPPQQKQDRNLMADMGQKKYSKKQQCHINNCRLYLRVEYLSDLCNESGTEILPELVDWHGPRTTSQPKKLFPKQACPGKRQWTLFRQFL